jgi:hypothetical protein
VGLAVQTALIVTIHNTQELCDFIRASFMYYVEISLQLFASAENLLGQNVSRDSLAGMYLYWVIQVGNHEDLFINPETLLKKNSLL